LRHPQRGSACASTAATSSTVTPALTSSRKTAAIWSSSVADAVVPWVRNSPGVRRLTLGADKGYNAATFVADMRALFGRRTSRRTSAADFRVDARTTRHAGYAEPFGWAKAIGGLARPMLRGVKKLGFKFILTMAGLNLIRQSRSTKTTEPAAAC
jgi:hypothetical protein